MDYTKSTVRRERNTQMRRSGSWTPVFDYLLALLGIFLIIAITEKPKAKPMRIDTLGVVAVKITWAAGSNDDVDLYVQDPQGNVAYFGAQDVGLLHLEYDDLGTAVSGTYTLPSGKVIHVRENSERLLVRGAVPGEYTVNVHMFRKDDPGPTRVTVQLWRLHGDNVVLYTRTVTLVRESQEETAFRFTLNAATNASGFTTLPKKLVGGSAAAARGGN